MSFRLATRSRKNTDYGDSAQNLSLRGSGTLGNALRPVSPPPPCGLRCDSLRSAGLPSRSSRSERRLVGRQDSNLQTDRYERPALTIELQAPPRDGLRRCAAGNGARFV